MKHLCIILLILLSWFKTEEREIKYSFKPIIKEQFLPVDVWIYIQTKEIKHKHIVYAQALLETGEFTSIIFKENKNLFGMKYVDTIRLKRLGYHYRPTVAIGEQYKHAKYLDWKKSIDDYLLWQQMFKRTPIETEQQYFALLNKGYAENPNYVFVLKQIIKQKKIPKY